MTRKPDYGVLLEKFGDGKSRPDAKPVRRSKRFGPTWKIPADIALPSLAELLRIDAAAERAVAASRIKQDASNVVGVDSEASGVVSMADGRTQ